MTTKTYKVICKECKATEDIVIDNQNNIYWKPVKNIISGRYRLDMQWGWQCICGNNDITTEQEQREISNLSAPDPVDISKVLKNLIPDQPRFKMEAI